ncbi:MAG: flagellar export chaperone FliS [Actinomycetes bacterium]
MALTAAAARARYLAAGTGTAPRPRLLVLLYDRLILDLERAEAAFTPALPATDGADRQEVGPGRERVTHAQDILAALWSALQTDEWDGGPTLAALYAHCLNQLSAAYVATDPGPVAECRALLDPVRDAWRRAVEELARAEPVALPAGRGAGA